MKLIIVALIVFGSIIPSQSQLSEGLWPMPDLLNSEQNNSRIVSFYDFNQDSFVDVLIENIQNHQITVYLWKGENGSFKKAGSVQIQCNFIESILVTNLNNDNLLDLIIMKEIQESQNPEYKLEMKNIFCSSFMCEFQTVFIQFPKLDSLLSTLVTVQNQPILLFFSEGKIQSLSYTNNSQKIEDFPLEIFIQKDNVMKSIVFGDYNGDCIQDLLIISSNRLHFFSGNINEGFESEGYIINTEAVQYGTLSDIDFDGLIDLLLLIKLGSKYYLQIHYNTKVIDSETICDSANHQIYFDFQPKMNQITRIQRIQLQRINQIQLQNPVIRVNDLNNDGYPDIIIDGGFKQTFLLQNQKCKSVQTCGQYNPTFSHRWDLLNLRKFRFINHKIFFSSEKYGELCGLSFFDLKEDGKMDLIAIFNHEKSQFGRVIPIINTHHLDAFFMKITIFQNRNSGMTNTLKNNFNGANVAFFVTSLNGQKVPITANQLMQPGKTLQLPYCFIGLGRTNNYIENLKVTLPIKHDQSKEWTPIIPNSQLIIIPGQKWVLKTYISPTQKMFFVFWCVILFLALIGGIIIYLTRQQRQQDKQKEQSFYTILR